MTSPPPTDRWPATVLVPTRDERDNAEPLLTRLPLVDAVLFVDDSDDDTPEAIAAAAPLCDSPVEVLHRPAGQRSGGLAGAVVAGMPLVKSKWTVVMDGDLQHPPGCGAPSRSGGERRRRPHHRESAQLGLSQRGPQPAPQSGFMGARPIGLCAISHSLAADHRSVERILRVPNRCD